MSLLLDYIEKHLKEIKPLVEIDYEQLQQLFTQTEVRHHQKQVERENLSVLEMWSFVEKKANQRWLWQAIERKSGKVLAYVFGTRNSRSFSSVESIVATFWD